jgi:hypothetical protein
VWEDRCLQPRIGRLSDLETYDERFLASESDQHPSKCWGVGGLKIDTGNWLLTSWASARGRRANGQR